MRYISELDPCQLVLSEQQSNEQPLKQTKTKRCKKSKKPKVNKVIQKDFMIRLAELNSQSAQRMIEKVDDIAVT